MKCVGVISTKGGLGNTTITLALAKVSHNSLAIDSSFGFRTFDLMLNLEDIVYDFYDYSQGIAAEKCIVHTDNMDVLCASVSKKMEDFLPNNLISQFNQLTYDWIFIDIPRTEEYISFYREICDSFLLISQSDELSIRHLEKIIYLLQKERKKRDIFILMNRLTENINLEDEKFHCLQQPNIKFVENIPQFNPGNIMEEQEFWERMNHVLAALNGETVEIVPMACGEKTGQKKTILEKLFRIRHE